MNNSKDDPRLAIAALVRAMKNDPVYARTWHQDIAKVFFNEATIYIGDEPDDMQFQEAADKAAARFMQQYFGVDTSKTP